MFYCDFQNNVLSLFLLSFVGGPVAAAQTLATIPSLVSLSSTEEKEKALYSPIQIDGLEGHSAHS